MPTQRGCDSRAAPELSFFPRAMHLLVAVTSHGFGHAAQVAPVVNALVRRLPGLRITVMSTVPGWFLRQRIQVDFELIERAADFGLAMNSALHIDLQRSAATYADLHRNWDRRVEREAHWLRTLKPDLVLADVPYLTLAAAQAAAVPALALCSLNWADIYRYYFMQRSEAPQVLEHMEAAYSAARAFLCPEPSMPMPRLANRVVIGPIAARGRARRDELNRRLGLASDTALVLVAPGGVKTRFAMETWPPSQAIHWLVSETWQLRHPHATPFEDTGMSFTDLVASSDAVLGKCGYGTVVECVANGTPLLYVARPGWPEEPVLLEWLRDHQAAVEVPAHRLVNGEFTDILAAAGRLQVKRCQPDGAEQAAALLQSCLQQAATTAQHPAPAAGGSSGVTT